MMLLRRTPRVPRPWHRRKPGFVAFLLLLSLFLLLALLHTRRPSVADRSLAAPTAANRPSSPALKSQAAFWRELYLLILQNDPKCHHTPELVIPQKLDVGFDATRDRPRPDLLYMEAADLKRLQDAHTRFVRDLKQAPPALIFDAGTRGVVVTASYHQLPVLVISLRMLRRTGSSLPVEVFVAEPGDYDEQICNHVLVALNARCVVLHDIFRAAESGVALDRFQYKIMAVLFSSFEQVLLLDSDAFPLFDPRPLFEQDPFLATGMVLWPDFWYPSESPYYFDIAQITPVPPLNARPAVESGEILFSKARHPLSIMLAAYYNYYGPEYFYPLLSQGAPGQGDKETFAWAAAALQLPVHVVHQRVMALGRTDSSGHFLGSAMVQHDPVSDLAHIQSQGSGSDSGRVPHPASDDTADSPFDVVPSEVRPFFIHANFPKFDPATIFDHQMRGFDDELTGGSPTRDTNGTSVRCWMSLQRAIEFFGFDVERSFWAEIMTTACENERHFGCWRGKQGICARVRQYWKDVFDPSPASSDAVAMS